MDTYQPIYDAVRSRMSNGDIGAAVESALRDANISHYVALAAESVRQCSADVAQEQCRPSILFRPELTQDGDQWIALLGVNLQEGVAGCGETPDAAMRAFDRAWVTARTPVAMPRTREGATV